MGVSIANSGTRLRRSRLDTIWGIFHVLNRVMVSPAEKQSDIKSAVRVAIVPFGVDHNKWNV